MTRTTRLTLITLTTAFATVGGLACTEDNPCDSSSYLDRGVCLRTEPVRFGDPCQNHQDCQDPSSGVNVCLVPPGPSVCSAIGCNNDPNICPDQWTCMDLAGSGFPVHACIPPEATPDGGGDTGGDTQGPSDGGQDTAETP